ncbi:bifunctional folylpolyglutamate synthase/dihydrofolate synthase [Candidatus Micrarchaeota archaeon]|nr:bifunctional folylpolyglutamate synthase/dihydrofolate synthase [Candidatus Micrarchaeota archaeon]
MKPFFFLEKFGSIPGLERIKKLLSEWKNPHKDLKVILVGGTNGKGSTVAFLSSILKYAGYKTGSFYSPHLLFFNERIQLDNIPIPDAELKKYEKKIKEFTDKGNTITYFEAVTAVAFDYFRKNTVDYAVMEVGMGGEHDATNISSPVLSIITSVSYEHTKHLGKTLTEIAKTKAGIIRKTSITSAEGEALQEIRKHSSEIHTYNKDFSSTLFSHSLDGLVFDYSGKGKFRLTSNLLGLHQMKNASLAVRAAELLNINQISIKKGIQNASIKARFEIFSKDPLIILDAAHNPSGIEALSSTLAFFNLSSLTIIFSCMKDKDWKPMLSNLSQFTPEFLFPRLTLERTESPDALKNKFNGKSFPSLKYALNNALEKNKPILITGSLYMMEDAYEALNKAKDEGKIK